MANSPQPTQQLAQGQSTPLKSVWKKFSEALPSNLPVPNTLGNDAADDSHDKDSVSSKDVIQGEGSEHGQSTSGSSMADETQGSPPAQPVVYRPAPLPVVNPWKARQEDRERKRWIESQEGPIAPLSMDRSIPKLPTNLPPRSTKLPNGVGQSDGNSHRRYSFADIV